MDAEHFENGFGIAREESDDSEAELTFDFYDCLDSKRREKGTFG